MKSSSRYSLVRILPASLSNSAPVPSHVALATVWCTFCRPPLPKVLRTSPFLITFMCKPGSAAVLCTLCRPHLPKVEIELSLQSCALFVDNLQPRKKRPTTETFLTEKTQCSAPKSVPPLNSCVPELSLFPTPG